jgi:hypothetical protein
VRLVIAWCSVEYEGRLGAHLPLALRLIMLKADGSVAIHSDSRAYKPLNWMSPPCTIREDPASITASNPKGERLTIELHDVVSDQTVDLGDDPGLAKDGVEAELQQLIAARVQALREDSASCGGSTRPTSARSICCAAMATGGRWSWR